MATTADSSPVETIQFGVMLHWQSRFVEVDEAKLRNICGIVASSAMR